MLNENRAWVMSILKNSESSKKIDCVINTVETASRLIVHAIKILDLSVLKVTSGKAVSLISYFCSTYYYSAAGLHPEINRFLILQEKPGKLNSIAISRDINTIALISTYLILFVSIHFLTIRRIMDLIQKYGKLS